MDPELLVGILDEPDPLLLIGGPEFFILLEELDLLLQLLDLPLTHQIFLLVAGQLPPRQVEFLCQILNRLRLVQQLLLLAGDRSILVDQGVVEFGLLQLGFVVRHFLIVDICLELMVLDLEPVDDALDLIEVGTDVFQIGRELLIFLEHLAVLRFQPRHLGLEVLAPSSRSMR